MTVPDREAYEQPKYGQNDPEPLRPVECHEFFSLRFDRESQTI